MGTEVNADNFTIKDRRIYLSSATILLAPELAAQ